MKIWAKHFQSISLSQTHSQVPCRTRKNDQVMKILRKRPRGSGFCNSIQGGPPLCHNVITDAWQRSTWVPWLSSASWQPIQHWTQNRAKGNYSIVPRIFQKNIHFVSVYLIALYVYVSGLLSKETQLQEMALNTCENAHFKVNFTVTALMNVWLWLQPWQERVSLRLPEEPECALPICDQSYERCTRMSVVRQNQSFPPSEVVLFFRDSARATLSN